MSEIREWLDRAKGLMEPYLTSYNGTIRDPEVERSLLILRTLRRLNERLDALEACQDVGLPENVKHVTNSRRRPWEIDP